MLLEPNDVVSWINGSEWPVRSQEMAWSDQLVAVDQISVQTLLLALILFIGKADYLLEGIE